MSGYGISINGGVYIATERTKDGAKSVYIAPIPDEQPIDKLHRFSATALENNMLDGIVEDEDGNFTVPSAYRYPNGDRCGGPYSVVFYDEAVTCDCTWGTYHPGECCVHIGAVYSFLMLRCNQFDPYHDQPSFVDQQEYSQLNRAIALIIDQTIYGIRRKVRVSNGGAWDV